MGQRSAYQVKIPLIIWNSQNQVFPHRISTSQNFVKRHGLCLHNQPYNQLEPKEWVVSLRGGSDVSWVHNPGQHCKKVVAKGRSCTIISSMLVCVCAYMSWKSRHDTGLWGSFFCPGSGPQPLHRGPPPSWKSDKLYGVKSMTLLRCNGFFVRAVKIYKRSKECGKWQQGIILP